MTICPNVLNAGEKQRLREYTLKSTRHAGGVFGAFGGRGNCPLLEECEAPTKCHARIGIGVCTLGSDCIYDEGHPPPHSWVGASDTKRCNYHPEGCP